ncbi:MULTISPECIES: hypothetical protein [Bacillus]|uniref:hypothetical protein n=1 Tax=Bacillus TaxID=1386 RepID=UPI000BB8FBC5|nr:MULTISPECIES: hypothetical protein [Bacillus]
MVKHSLYFIGACFFGYKFIDIFPKADSFNELLSIFVFSPFTLFSSLTCLLFSFIFYGELFHELRYSRHIHRYEKTFFVGIMVSLVLLVLVGGMKGVLLLLFSIIYGMISAVNTKRTIVKGVK